VCVWPYGTKLTSSTNVLSVKGENNPRYVMIMVNAMRIKTNKVVRWPILS